MNTDKKRQTTLQVTYPKLPQWQRLLAKMQACTTLDALITLHGPPHQKSQRDGCETWLYPLGVESEMFYSIHVWVSPNQSNQAYVYFEPTSEHPA